MQNAQFITLYQIMDVDRAKVFQAKIVLCRPYSLLMYTPSY